MSHLGTLSIRGKLRLSFGVIAILAVIVGLMAATINSQIRRDVFQISQAAIEKAGAVNAMAESLLELKLYTEESLTGHNGSVDVSRSITDTIQEFEAGLAISQKDARQSVELGEREENAEEIRQANEEVSLLGDLDLQFVKLKKLIKLGFHNTNKDRNRTEADEAHLLVWNDFEQVSVLVEKYEENSKIQLAEEVKNVEAALGQANVILITFALLIMILASFLTWYISRNVSQPIGKLGDFARRIGHGNLDATVNIQTRDEFGLLAETFNQMTHDLRSKTVSKDYVDSILKSMVDTLIVVGPNHTIQSVNEAALHLLNYQRGALIGQSMDRVLYVSPNDSHCVLDEALEKGFISNVDVTYQAQDSRSIPMAFSASILRDSAGKVSGLVCVAQDVSARKEAERRLEQANKQLFETSRQAGMAEVATSVLHNVGNVLNSVNVSSDLISGKVRNSKVASFAKAVALMEEHQSDLPSFFAEDEKGKKLPGYLSKLAVCLEHEQKEILQEVASLAGNILHIKEIVATQQNYARVLEITESLRITDLLEDAVRINAGAMERHKITVIREYSEISPILVEKHKVLQILVNLISNAKYACEEWGQGSKEITLRVTQANNSIKICITDNGIGISPENLTHIFAYGFTTKKEGHGFGLHSSALAAKEMNGTLGVYSAGRGRGATFTLELLRRQDKI